MSIVRYGWALMACAALAACASAGPAGNPVERKLTWFSYLNGDDLRVACAQDGPDRFRMVFNADYNEHVRTYDVTGDPDGGASVAARVIKAPDLARVDLADPVGAWKGDEAQTRLSPTQYAMLVIRLYESGAFQMLPERLRLPSNSFYWLVSGCRDGQWFFTAYPYPSDRFADIRFAEPLGAMDPTGVAPPRLPSPADAPRSLPPGSRQQDGGVFFEIEVSGKGLVGPHLTLGPWPFAGWFTPRNP
ncbi:hypothetical protein [Azospirillum oleiclasticum]|uniref:hypothetical protein n=1 Tax=Azospirillum oleiclasticum TaxID=2735135 RepID=UPI001FE74083|nr:hypothetical protein [Azospirillum oleiclasticum]